MNRLLRKEVQLLRPAWAMALGVALVTLGLVTSRLDWVGHRGDFISFLIFGAIPLLGLVLALNSFGREITSGTLANLLAQPVERRQIWQAKTRVLAVALASVSLVWILALVQNPGEQIEPVELGWVLLFGVTSTCAIYSGALWTTLLLRQIAPAFWLTIIVPAALVSFAAYVAQLIGLGGQIPVVIHVGLVLYAIAGYVVAERAFQRAQDVQWTGGEISLPNWLSVSRRSARTGARSHSFGPRLSLVWKEVQLHQSQFIIAGVLAVIHLILIAIRPEPHMLSSSPMMELVYYYYWALWPLMGVLVGCAAVAEERRCNTLETQHCLPVRRRTQFAIKLLVALGLALIFGALMPVLFEGARILPEYGRATRIVSPIGPLVAACAALFGASFFASTLSRSALQAIAPTLGLISLLWILGFGAIEARKLTPPPWQGPLVFFIGVPVLALTLVGLAYFNFKQVLTGWPLWRRNLLTFLATILGVSFATAAIYHRAWEVIAPLEPAHGPARLARGTSVDLNVGGGFLMVQLPGGNVWQGRLRMVETEDYSRPKLASARFLPGSNWVAADALLGGNVTAGIRPDGSLWLLENVQATRRATNAPPPEPIRIGTDSDWRGLIRQGWSSAFLLLKQDGSLWQWGTNRFNFGGTNRLNWPGLAAFQPQRLGADSNWHKILWADMNLFFTKTNGEVWMRNPSIRSKDETAVELAPDFQIWRVKQLEGHQWRSLESGRGMLSVIGVSDTGALREFNLWSQTVGASFVSADQIGNETNWAASDFGGSQMGLALKTDGTLWRWEYPSRYENSNYSLRDVVPKRFSKYDDWIAVAAWWDGNLAVAADGNIWFWPSADYPIESGRFSLAALLGPSRRPLLLANIFTTASAPTGF